MAKELRRSLLKTVISKGYQITPDALDYLLELPEPEERVMKLLSGNHLLSSSQVVTVELLRNSELQEPPTITTDSLESIELLEDQTSPTDLVDNIEDLKSRHSIADSKEQQKPPKYVKLYYTTNKGKKDYIRVLDSINLLRVTRPPFYQSEYRDPFSGIKPDLDYDEIIPFLDLEPLRKCKQLRVLSLTDLGFENLDLSPLEDCLNLHTITISNTINPYVIVLDKKDKPNYQRLFIGHIKHIDLTPLANLKNLRVLKLHGLQTGTIDLNPLKHCPCFEEIEISGSVMLNKEGVIKNLDLVPLSECNNLQVIKLSLLDTKSINLQPLRKCIKLREITIEGYPSSYRVEFEGYNKRVFNPEDDEEYDSIYRELDLGRAAEIDLSFFTCFPYLEKLNLNNYNLNEIDFTLLSNCRHLSELYLIGNGSYTIDLTPARYLPMDVIELSTEKIDTRQTDPFVLSQRTASLLNEENYEKLPTPKGYSDLPILRDHQWSCSEPILLSSMSAIKFYQAELTKYNEAPWKFLHLLQCMPNVLGIHPIGLYDGDAKILLEKLLSIYQPDKEDVVVEILIKEMTKQIDRGGTTIGIDLGDNAYPEFLLKLDRIIELRESEMNNVIIPVNENDVDYLPLWCTEYGNQILGAIKPREIKYHRRSYNIAYYNSLPTIENVRQEIEKIGYNIKIINNSSPDFDEIESSIHTKIAEPAREYLSIMLNSREKFSSFNKFLGFEF